MEGGPPIFRQDGSCPALLKDVAAGVPYGAVTRCGPPFQALPVPNRNTTGLVRFRSPLLAESRLMSFPPATEMFQFAGFASRTYEFSTGYPPSFPERVGCPIRRPRDHRSLASPPGFSQRATSFIASQCQGIHQMPFLLFDPRTASCATLAGAPTTPPGTPPRTAASANGAPAPPPPKPLWFKTLSGSKPLSVRRAFLGPMPAAVSPDAGVSPEDTSSDGPTRKLPACAPGPVRLGHIHKSASPDQTPPAPVPRPPAREASRPAAPRTPERNPNLLRMPMPQITGRRSHVRTQRPEPSGPRSDLRHPIGGGERDRTDDLLLAKQALSQLSYTPAPEIGGRNTEIRLIFRSLTSDLRALTMVGQGGFEPPTSRLSSARSNQLSY